MKKDKNISRYSITLAVTLGYLLPVLALTVYGNVVYGYAWELFSVGIITGLLGSLFFFWLLSKWTYNSSDVEESVSLPTPEPTYVSVPESKVDEGLLHELEHYKEENVALQEKLHFLDEEKTSLVQSQSQMAHDFEAFKISAHQHLEHQQQNIRQLQETIAEQKSLVEKKHQQVIILETKVNDLTYEIKTLLKLAESHVSSFSKYQEMPTQEESSPQSEMQNPQPQDFQIQTSEEASRQLRKCIDMAQKITGSHRFGGQLHSLIDSPIDSFTLDLRRLCDTLRNENSSCILLYSPRENQMIFVNNQIKALTGWSPEKFTQAFFDIVQNSNEWKSSLGSLAMRSEAQLNLTLKTKWGHEVDVHGQVGMIPTGIFRQHAIAILYI